jgi:hypothetical protein
MVALMRSPLPTDARVALAETLARHGEIAVAAAVGTAPGTLRRARRGATLNPTTITALRAYLAHEAIAA